VSGVKLQEEHKKKNKKGEEETWPLCFKTNGRGGGGGKEGRKKRQNEVTSNPFRNEVTQEIGLQSFSLV